MTMGSSLAGGRGGTCLHVLPVSEHCAVSVPLPWCPGEVVHGAQGTWTALAARPEASLIFSADFLLILIFLSLHI